MPGSTTNLGLSLPLGGDAPSQLRLSVTANANSLDAYLLLTSVVTNVASAGVLRGQSVIASPSTTQTLPAASANAMAAVTASSTVTGAAPVTVAGSNIYGVGLSGASSFKLGTPGACAILQSDGTNWFVIAGQQDTGWVALTRGTGVSDSGAYPAAARVKGDRVDLCGVLTSAGTTAWGTVPAAAKPSGTGGLAAVNFGPFTGLGLVAVDHTTGNITSGTSSTTLALDNLSYRLS